jgi:hypothetical protein
MKYLVAFWFLFIVIGCSENKTPGVQVNNDTVQFFQLKQFINSEIAGVKRTPYFIFRIVEQEGKKDSTPVSNDAFVQMSQPFIDADINDPKLKKYYTESVFADQSTASYVLNYTANDASMQVQNIDVMLNAEDQKVKRIDIRKIYNLNDTSFTEHLVWKPNESFQVIKTAVLDTIQTTSQTRVIWNSKN